ncbi:hypothetical protein [Seleniivibrio sp.]|uniref:hypothetical protein n=1 Tax=Seleniivibrio sp. TaxID=2898801 RepID=UPI0025DD9636|nr:hypothetical protein [Seleniivibrio sp.]MCD8554123.1 hypothetical protein [Seleniivibrio sp.]
MKSLLLFVLMMSSLCVYAKEYDFRNVNWGMSKAEVKKSEKAKLYKESNELIVYSSKILGKNVIIMYIFTQNKLVRAKYGVTEEHSNKNRYIDDYDDLKGVLIKKYGKPITENEYWENDLFKDNYQNWGVAISVGHLSYFTNWETNSTKLILGLYGENFDIKCVVEYISKEYEQAEEDENEKKDLKDF